MAEAMRLAEAGLGYLRDPGAASLTAGELGQALQAIGVLGGKLAAARAAILARFDAERAYTADGPGGTGPPGGRPPGSGPRDRPPGTRVPPGTKAA